MFETGADPAAIVEAKGLKQISDAGALERIAEEIIAANPDQVEKLKSNPKVFGWFVGQVMKATEGQANPQLVNEVLEEAGDELGGPAVALHRDAWASEADTEGYASFERGSAGQGALPMPGRAKMMRRPERRQLRAMTVHRGRWRVLERSLPIGPEAMIDADGWPRTSVGGSHGG